MVSLHTAPHLHVCRSVTRARAKWSVNALQCCEAIYRGLGVVAENILWPAGTRGARKRSRKKNDWGWRDAASRYPQSLPRHVFFRAPHVPAGRESFLKTASNPRYNAPRGITMHLPTILLARESRTGKQAGTVLCATRPFKSLEPKGVGRVRSLRSERCWPDGCRGQRTSSAILEKGPKSMAARGSGTKINYN